MWAADSRGLQASHVAVMPMPNVDDLRRHLLSQDAVYVGGGSVAGLMVLWRLHGLDVVMREAWEAGVVLFGVSAGSLCWHSGGTTDSYGPELRPWTDGLVADPRARTARTTTARRADARSTSASSPRASSRRATPPMTASACTTSARRCTRRSATARASRLTASR